jgi:predicted DNA-binding transcriptional regulator YafY
VGDQLYLERFVWFDHEARRERFPNANTLGEHFEIAQKTAQRSIDHFRDLLCAPLEYDKSHKGYFYTYPTFQLPVLRISEEELLALLIRPSPMRKASLANVLLPL